MKWYVFYTRSRCEKKVAAILCKRGYENYCPLIIKVKRWSDRKKIIHEPLFNSYVFVRTNDSELSKIKSSTNDIVNIVYWLGKPAIVRDEEILEIRNFLNEYTDVKIEKSQVNLNDKVRIVRGPLMNYEGEVLSVSNTVVKLLLPSLGYMMLAEISRNNIRLIEKENKNIYIDYKSDIPVSGLN